MWILYSSSHSSTVSIICHTRASSEVHYVPWRGAREVIKIPNCTREHTLWPAHEGLPGTSSNVKLAKNIILFAYRYLLTLSECVSCSYRPLQKWWDNGILTQQRKFQQPPWPHPITVNSCQILLWRRMLSACIGTKPSAMGDILGLVGTTRPKGKHLKYIRLYLPTNPFTLILNPPSF